MPPVSHGRRLFPIAAPRLEWPRVHDNHVRGYGRKPRQHGVHHPKAQSPDHPGAVPGARSEERRTALRRGALATGTATRAPLRPTARTLRQASSGWAEVRHRRDLHGLTGRWVAADQPGQFRVRLELSADFGASSASVRETELRSKGDAARALDLASACQRQLAPALVGDGYEELLLLIEDQIHEPRDAEGWPDQDTLGK